MKKNILFFCLMMFLFVSCQKEEIEPLVEQSCLISKEILPNVFFLAKPDTTLSLDTIPCEYISYVYDKNKKLQKRIMYQQLGSPTALNYYNQNLTRTILDSIIYNANGIPFENFHREISIMKHEKFFYDGNMLKKIDFTIYYKASNSNWTTYDKIGFEEFFYDSNKKLIKSEYSIKKASLNSFEKTIKTYSYTDNNLYRIDIYKNKVETSNTIGYELYENYDNNKNPYAYLFFLSDKRRLSLSNNNYQSTQYHYKTDYSESSGHSNYVYKGYNESGYPTDYPYGFFNLKLEYIID